MKTSVREACWLLRCAGFGAPSAEVQRVRRIGAAAWIDEALHRPPGPCAQPWTTRFPPGIPMTAVQLGGLIAWWVGRMMQPAEQLREKMTLFWHGLFTTSADPVFSSGLLLCQNQLLREHAFANFEDLLQAVSRDPAMLIYLDGFRNRKEHPNENFAREVMELFTVGTGQYSETDLREAARAFTGWELAWWRGAQFRANPAHHDGGPKHFLELRGELNGQQILHRLARDPACARHVCGRLWSFLTGGVAPTTELERLARCFEASHGNMGVVLKTLLLGEAFRSAAEPRNQVQSPLEYVVGFCRTVDRPFATGVQAGGWDWRQLPVLKRMGEMPFFPPSVAGWRPSGWLDTATLHERLLWMRQAWNTHATSLTDRLHQQLQGCSAAQATERTLWLTNQLDGGSALREALAARFHGPVSAPDMLQLSLFSPEGQLR